MGWWTHPNFHRDLEKCDIAAVQQGRSKRRGSMPPASQRNTASSMPTVVGTIPYTTPKVRERTVSDDLSPSPAKRARMESAPVSPKPTTVTNGLPSAFGSPVLTKRSPWPVLQPTNRNLAVTGNNMPFKAVTPGKKARFPAILHTMLTAFSKRKSVTAGWSKDGLSFFFDSKTVEEKEMENMRPYFPRKYTLCLQVLHELDRPNLLTRCRFLYRL